MVMLHVCLCVVLQAKELQTLHNLRKLFVQDLQARVMKVGNRLQLAHSSNVFVAKFLVNNNNNNDRLSVLTVPLGTNGCSEQCMQGT